MIYSHAKCILLNGPLFYLIYIAIQKKQLKEPRLPGNIYINAGEIGDNIFMEFSDNGDGIPEENQNKIFNAFFTTSSQKGHSASKEDELTGTGLGLKIIKDIN